MKFFAMLTLLLLLAPAVVNGIGAPELHYGDHTWSFVGYVDEFERYDMRTMVVDLVRVHYTDEGEWRRIWVAAGVEILSPPYYGQYLGRGPWDKQDEIHTQLESGDPIRVYIQGNGVRQPIVTRDGIDWNDCQSMECLLGAYFAETAPLDEHFISGGSAPGWHPWGFLVWQIELFDEEFIRIWRLIE